MEAIAHTNSTQVTTTPTRRVRNPLTNWSAAESCKVSRKGGMGKFENLQEWFEEAIFALAEDVVKGREFCLYPIGSEGEITEFDLLASTGLVSVKTDHGVVKIHLVDVYEGQPEVQRAECLFVFRFTVGDTTKLYKTRCPKGKEVDLEDWRWSFTPIGEDAINPRHARDLMVGYPYSRERVWSNSWGKGILGNITFEGERTARDGKIFPSNGMYLTPKDLSFEEFLSLPSRPADEEGDKWYGQFKSFEREQKLYQNRSDRYEADLEEWQRGVIEDKPQKPYVTPTRVIPPFRSYYIRWMKNEVYFRTDFPTVYEWVMENFDNDLFFDFDEIYG